MRSAKRGINLDKETSRAAKPDLGSKPSQATPVLSPFGIQATRELGSYGGIQVAGDATAELEELLPSGVSITINPAEQSAKAEVELGSKNGFGISFGGEVKRTPTGVSVENVSFGVNALGFGVNAEGKGSESGKLGVSAFGISVDVANDKDGKTSVRLGLNLPGISTGITLQPDGTKEEVTPISPTPDTTTQIIPDARWAGCEVFQMAKLDRPSIPGQWQQVTGVKTNVTVNAFWTNAKDMIVVHRRGYDYWPAEYTAPTIDESFSCNGFAWYVDNFGGAGFSGSWKGKYDGNYYDGNIDNEPKPTFESICAAPGWADANGTGVRWQITGKKIETEITRKFVANNYYLYNFFHKRQLYEFVTKIIKTYRFTTPMTPGTLGSLWGVAQAGSGWVLESTQSFDFIFSCPDARSPDKPLNNIVQIVPQDLPNYPQRYKPMNCCDKVEEIYKYLGIAKMKKKFKVSKQFLVPGGKGNEECEDYYALNEALFRMLANGLILNPISTPLGSEWKSVNATAWAGQVYEMVAEAMSNGDTTQKFEISAIMQLVQTMSAVAELSRKVDFISEVLGVTPDLGTEDLPVCFTIHESHKGFEKKKPKEIDVSAAKTDDEVEKVLGKMLRPSKIPIVKWEFKPDSVSIAAALNRL